LALISSIPINIKQSVFPSARLKALARSVTYKLGAATPCPETPPPYFKITDDDGTASLFLEALSDFRLDAARGLISKNFAGSIDVLELAAFLEGSAAYKPLVRAEFSSCPKNCKVTSVLMAGGENAAEAIVHLRMIKEPDSISCWKIYSVEREN